MLNLSFVLICLLLTGGRSEPITIGGAVLLGAWAINKLLPTCSFDESFQETFDDFMLERVYGQHIASRLVSTRVREHLETVFQKSDEALLAKALAMSFHGGTGTGKTYIANFIRKSLYGSDDKKNPTVFIAGTDFTDPTRKENYKKELHSIVDKQIKRCPTSLFIFLESDKFVPGVLEVLFPLLEYGVTNINGLDYSRAVYVFQSNLCADKINEEFDIHLKLGHAREEITYNQLDRVLKKCLRSSSHGPTELHRKETIDFIPFLPLQRQHVIQCVEEVLRSKRESGIARERWRNLTWSGNAAAYAADQIRMHAGISVNGCKVTKQVENVLLTEVNLQNRQRQGRYKFDDSNVHISLSDEGDQIVVTSTPVKKDGEESIRDKANNFFKTNKKWVPKWFRV